MIFNALKAFNSMFFLERRLFSSSSNNRAIWEKLSLDNKINIALAESEPETAEMAYYKAIGLTHFPDKLSEAVYFFKKSFEMDPAYELISKKQIAAIYASLGQIDKAYATVKSILDKIPEDVLANLKPTSPEPVKAKQA